MRAADAPEGREDNARANKQRQRHDLARPRAPRAQPAREAPRRRSRSHRRTRAQAAARLGQQRRALVAPARRLERHHVAAAGVVDQLARRARFQPFGCGKCAGFNTEAESIREAAGSFPSTSPKVWRAPHENGTDGVTKMRQSNVSVQIQSNRYTDLRLGVLPVYHLSHPSLPPNTGTILPSSLVIYPSKVPGPNRYVHGSNTVFHF